MLMICQWQRIVCPITDGHHPKQSRRTWGLSCLGPRKSYTMIAKAKRPTDWKLREFFEAVYCVQNTKIAGGSYETVRCYSSEIAKLEKFWKARHAQSSSRSRSRPLLVSDCSDELLSSCMLDQLNSGLAPDTCNKFLRSLRAILTSAVKEHGCPGTVPNVKPYKTPKRKPECWTIDEFNQLLEAASRMPGYIGRTPASDWFVALLLFAFNTGLRISTIMRLPHSALDARYGRIIVPAELQKQQEEQSFDLFDITLKALREISPQRFATLFGEWDHDQAAMQFDVKRKNRMPKKWWQTLTNRLRQLIVDAGLRPTPKDVKPTDLWHKLRRMFVTYVNRSGGKALAQQYAGHSHSSVTDRYIDTRLSERPMLRDLLPEPTLPKRLGLWSPETADEIAQDLLPPSDPPSGEPPAAAS